MKTRTAPARVSISFEGKSYEGHWTIERGVVRVVSAYGEKSTQVGGSPADFVAKRLLRELVQASQE
jgi:hypothetical protein